MKFILQEKGDTMISLMNNYTISHQPKFTSRQNYHNARLSRPIAEESQHMSTGAKIGTISGAGIAGILCLANRKKLGAIVTNFAASASGKISKVFGSDVLKPVDVSEYRRVNLKERAKEIFLNHFINPITKPNIIETNTAGGVKVTQRFTPANGYLVYGPDSKAKEEHFNWVLKELEEAGVEVIDAGKGKSGQEAQMDVYKAWWNMWKNTSDEKFLQKGKYKAFVVRNLDEFPDTGFLKDSPDSNDCCKKHGIMLIYSCKNPGNIDPPVIRHGRVDAECLPEPNADEPLEIWKKYLEFAIHTSASLAHRSVESAKELLSQNGAGTLAEMKNYLQYSIPYKYPRVHDSLDKWQQYVTETSKNVHTSCMFNELATSLHTIIGECRGNTQNMQKFHKIVKMTEEVMPKDKLDEWKLIVEKIEKGKI